MEIIGWAKTLSETNTLAYFVLWSLKKKMRVTLNPDQPGLSSKPFSPDSEESPDSSSIRTRLEMYDFKLLG